MSQSPTSEIIPSPLLRALELQNLGHLDESAGLFRSVLATQPDDPIALYALSGILMRTEARDEVLALTERGVQQAADFPPMWFARAGALLAAGRRDEAVRAYDQAIDLNPEYVEALASAGQLLRELQRPHEALQRFQRLLDVDPRHPLALAQAGMLLGELQRGHEATGLFERLLAVEPDHPYAAGRLCDERLKACDWRDHPRLAREIVDGLRAGRRTTPPRTLMALDDNAADHLRAARMLAAQTEAPAPLWKGERYTHRRLRIAYVSPDVGDGPVGQLLAGVLEQHDRARFEVIGVSLGRDDGSRQRTRLVTAFDRFIDAAGQDGRQVAQWLRDMEVDVAINLAGHSSDAHAEVFAHRAAPVQVNFLGWAGSMGTACHDYIVADRYVIPPAHQSHYGEKIAYLPDSFLPTDASLVASESTPRRAACGLPDDGVVFCAFSPDRLVNPALFDVWMRILRRTPGSVLWLASRRPASQENLRREAEARGVDPSRLVFAPRLERTEDQLARLRLADLFLDTSPCNAHAGAAEALQVGVPVITCSGDSFASRATGSLLRAIGMPELITASLDAYESLAVELAADPERMAGCSAWLMANQETHALFDTARYTRHLEGALLKMARETGATTLREAGSDGARHLHIGAAPRADIRRAMHAAPGDHVDQLGEASDLARFEDDGFDAIHAANVISQADDREALALALREWRRVLKPGGSLVVSVPDLDALADLILDKSLTLLDRFMTMRMIFGGRAGHDERHRPGLTAESLAAFLADAGFVDIAEVDGFGPADDAGSVGRRVSLHLRAVKPTA